MRRLLPCFVALGFFSSSWSPAASNVPERRVVLMVWDGMRPDFIRADLTPNLWALAQRGVFFKNHHAVFMSST